MHASDPAASCPPLPTAAAAEAALALLPDAVLALSDEGRILSANAEARRLLGVPPGAPLPESWRALPVFAGKNEAFAALLASPAPDTTTEPRQTPFTPSIGCPRTLSVIAAPCGVGARVLILQDVTELLLLRESEDTLRREAARFSTEKTDSLVTLASAVAHQIRNPITVLGGFAARLQRHNPDLEYLPEILEASRRLERLVAEVAEYAELPPLQQASLSLSEWLRALMPDLVKRAESRGATLVLDDAWPFGALILFDPSLLRRVLLILLDNALDAMNGTPGVITLRISTTPLSAILELSDSGSGLKPDHLPLLFQPFFSTKPRGLGLNLTKAQRIIQEHGGTLALTPNIPRGVTATISLPLGACQESA